MIGNDGKTYKLKTPLKVSIAKSTVKVVYPLEYFNSYPYYINEKIYLFKLGETCNTGIIENGVVK